MLTVTFCDGNLLSDQRPTDDAVNLYAAMLASELARRLGRDVIVTPRRNTSGAPVDCSDDDLLPDVELCANEVWEKWAEALTDADTCHC